MIDWLLIFLGGLLGSGHYIGVCGAFAVAIGWDASPACILVSRLHGNDWISGSEYPVLRRFASPETLRRTSRSCMRGFCAKSSLKV